MDVNRAPYDHLLRVPGIGVTSAKRIVIARRGAALNFDTLKKLGGCTETRPVFHHLRR